MPIDTDYCNHLPRFINDTLSYACFNPAGQHQLANLATRKKQ
jgi:hypothetical protein